MGRRKQKQMLFVQGAPVAEEDSGDEQSGGLHIGNAVVLRAPMSSRSRFRAGSLHRDRRVSSAAKDDASSSAAGVGKAGTMQMQDHIVVSDSDASLEDELKDYLDNIQHTDGNNTEALAASHKHCNATTAEDSSAETAAAAAAAAGLISPGSSWGDWDDSNSCRAGIGFQSAAAAACFAGVSLDRALEGTLARDLMSTGLVDTSDSSDSDSSDSDGSSTSGDFEGGAHCSRGGLAVPDGSTAVVVDAQGQPMALWEQLPLQQRFPVQKRQQHDLRGLQDLKHGSNSSSGSKKGKSMKDSRHRQTPSRSNSSGRATVLAPPDMPCFACEATAAAVSAAYAAAVAAADLDSVHRQQQRRQQKSLAKGANRGQLLPGEKKKLRKEKIAAKRAVRQSERGQRALTLLAAVEEFALSGGDMTLLPPCSKHTQAFTRSVAALYGVKASAQGGSSSSKTSLILMSTPNTSTLTADAALQLQQLLTAQLTQELMAAAIAGGLEARGMQDSAAVQPSNRQEMRSPPVQGLPRQRSRGAAAAAVDDESVFQQPVAFVSAGMLDPNSSSRTDHGQQQQQQAASIQAGSEPLSPAAAAAAGVPAMLSVNSSAVTVEAAGAATASFVQSLLLDVENKQQGTAEQQPQVQQEHQQQMHLQQQQSADTQQQHLEAAWFIDKAPCPDTQQHRGLGFAGGSTAAAATGFGKQGAPAGEAGCAPVAAEGHATPLYDRPALHFGLGFSSRVEQVGFVQQQQGHCFGEVGHVLMYNTAAGGQQQEQDDVAPAAVSAAGSTEGTQRLRGLEDKFAALRTAANPAAVRRQQRRQQQLQQHQVQARLPVPSTALGPVIAAAAAVGHNSSGLSDEDTEGPTGLITLGLTKQQVKKAKKQQQRNARREARAAAAAEGDAEAAAPATGNVSGTFAGFEAHTRGIGSRLMAGWGWREGEGLGRARQGRPEPLQASRRARNQGLGAA